MNTKVRGRTLSKGCFASNKYVILCIQFFFTLVMMYYMLMFGGWCKRCLSQYLQVNF